MIKYIISKDMNLFEEIIDQLIIDDIPGIDDALNSNYKVDVIVKLKNLPVEQVKSKISQRENLPKNSILSQH